MSLMPVYFVWMSYSQVMTDSCDEVNHCPQGYFTGSDIGAIINICEMILPDIDNIDETCKYCLQRAVRFKARASPLRVMSWCEIKV